MIARGRIVRAAVALGVFVLAAFVPSAPVRAAGRARPAPSPPAKAFLLADLDTGRVIASYNDHALLRPASLTKMLTALVAVNWVPPTAIVPVSSIAANVTPDRVGMRPGQRWTLAVTLHALLIVSANDAAYALAQRVSGSLARFATAMQKAAAQMGMTDTPVLHDPAGLDGTEGYAGGNLLSAWDLAVAGRDLLANQALRAIVGTHVFWFTSPSHVVNELVNFNGAFLNSYPGAIGVKTGFTDRAGVCVVDAATRGTRTMLAVVMNGITPDATAEALLTKGFETPPRAEHGPLLPSARQPSPHPPPPLPRPKAHPAAPRPLEAAAANPSNGGLHGAPLIAAYVATAALVAGTALLVLLGAIRRRRRGPVGLHARRPAQTPTTTASPSATEPDSRTHPYQRAP